MAISNQGSFIERHSVSPDFYSRRLENEKFDIALCLTSRSIVNRKAFDSPHATWDVSLPHAHAHQKTGGWPKVVPAFLQKCVASCRVGAVLTKVAEVSGIVPMKKSR